MSEVFPSPRDMARALLRARRLARRARARLRKMPKALRGPVRDLMKQVYRQQALLEDGLPTTQEELRCLRRLRLLQDELARAVEEPGRLDELDPDDILGVAPFPPVTAERHAARPVMRIHWPLRYDTYRFQRLGKILFHFLDLFHAQEARTRACLELLTNKDLVREHTPRKRDIDKHEGILALPPKRKTPTPQTGAKDKVSR